MSAKEMFKELGYECYQDIAKTIYDEHLVPNCHIDLAFIKAEQQFGRQTFIYFLEDKTILKWSYSYQRSCYITHGEIKAIQKQIEELG